MFSRVAAEEGEAEAGAIQRAAPLISGSGWQTWPRAWARRAGPWARLWPLSCCCSASSMPATSSSRSCAPPSTVSDGCSDWMEQAPEGCVYLPCVEFRSPKPPKKRTLSISALAERHVSNAQQADSARRQELSGSEHRTLFIHAGDAVPSLAHDGVFKLCGYTSSSDLCMCPCRRAGSQRLSLQGVRPHWASTSAASWQSMHRMMMRTRKSSNTDHPGSRTMTMTLTRMLTRWVFA